MERTTEFAMGNYVKTKGEFSESDGVWFLDMDRWKSALETDQDIDKYDRVLDDLSNYKPFDLRQLVGSLEYPLIIKFNDSYYNISRDRITVTGDRAKKQGMIDMSYDWDFFANSQD